MNIQMIVVRILSYVCAILLGIIIGANVMRVHLEQTTAQESQAKVVQRKIENNDGTKTIVATRNGSSRIDFTFANPIAPDYYVGCGFMGHDYEMFENNPEYDPLNIGSEYAAKLTKRIRQEVQGVEEEIYAKGYQLTMDIAESHEERLDEIINEVLAIINGDPYS